MEHVYFKDAIIPKGEAAISIDDRSFRFGDGIFETILIYNRKPYDIAAHLTRLQSGLEQLGIRPALPDIRSIPSICGELISKNDIEQGYIRIIVSRGENTPDAVGYMPPGNAQPYIIIQTVSRPLAQTSPIKLWVSETTHATAHLKSKINSSLPYVMAMMEAREQGCDNAIILDTSGHICETASGNIFWVENGEIYTPSTDLPFIGGTVRQKILKLYDRKIHQGRYTLEDITPADEVFMTNIGCIVAPVTEVRPLGISLTVGSVTREIQNIIKSDISTSLAV